MWVNSCCLNGISTLASLPGPRLSHDSPARGEKPSTAGSHPRTQGRKRLGWGRGCAGPGQACSLGQGDHHHPACTHTHTRSPHLPLCYSALLSAQISLPLSLEAAPDTYSAPGLRWQIPENPQGPSVLGGAPPEQYPACPSQGWDPLTRPFTSTKYPQKNPSPSSSLHVLPF